MMMMMMLWCCDATAMIMIHDPRSFLCGQAKFKSKWRQFESELKLTPWIHPSCSLRCETMLSGDAKHLSRLKPRRLSNFWIQSRSQSQLLECCWSWSHLCNQCRLYRPWKALYRPWKAQGGSGSCIRCRSRKPVHWVHCHLWIWFSWPPQTNMSLILSLHSSVVIYPAVRLCMAGGNWDQFSWWRLTETDSWNLQVESWLTFDIVFHPWAARPCGFRMRALSKTFVRNSKVEAMRSGPASSLDFDPHSLTHSLLEIK